MVSHADVERLLDGSQIAAVIDLLYGDGGKGKMCDLFAQYFDAIFRTHGGPNAGNTIFLEDGRRLATHLLPTGINHDKDGKMDVIAQGVAVDPGVLCGELDDLDELGMTYNNLRVSGDAPVIMPYHVTRDRARNQSQAKGGIGSTGKGVGPCYADEAARRSVFVRDLGNPDVLVRKIRKAMEFYPEQTIDEERIISDMSSLASRLQPFMWDTNALIHEMIGQGKRILLGGSHGTLLSYKHGMSPYVTSSDCSVNGVASGAGIAASIIDAVFGIVKFPLNTRVGGGPFPTELGGSRSEEYCAETNSDGSPKYGKSRELAMHGIAHEVRDGEVIYDTQDPKIVELMNSDDEFERGVGMRLAADEYGATTTRPRRPGEGDAIAIRYARRVNGPLKLVLTKPDSLAGIEEFRVCYGFTDPLTDRNTTTFSRDSETQRRLKPSAFRTYSGYGDISQVRDYDDLPGGLRESMRDLEEFTGAPISVVSVGKEREQTIIV